VLREVRPDDLPILYEIERDLASWEERTPAAPGPLTWEAFREAHRDTGTGFVITVDDQVVGRCGLMHEDLLARHAEVGISVAAAARGQGYGTDALRVLAEFAFVRRNLRRLHLETLADNAAAVAAYRKVGFVEEGRPREHAWVRGAYVDMLRMGLLRSEWTGR